MHSSHTNRSKFLLTPTDHSDPDTLKFENFLTVQTNLVFFFLKKMAGEILVVPKNGQGHLFPCMELCKHLVHRNFKITLIIDSDISSSVPPSLQRSPLFEIADISSSPAPGSESQLGFHRQHQQMALGLESLLTRRRSENPDSTRPVCAILDHIMSKNQEAFWKFDIPTVVFITSGAAWAAIQHAAWKVQPGDMKPGETRVLPGLPEDTVLRYADLKQRRHWIPQRIGGGGNGSDRIHGSGTGPNKSHDGGNSKPPRGPPFPGEPAPWVVEVENSAAIVINTCNDLERPFLDYVATLTGKPVWGVGPLLPEQYWQSADSLLRDRDIRPNRESNYTNDEIIEWLDSKPHGSVMYISFGSEVGPSEEEYPELAAGLEESNRPFIWVIQRPSKNLGPGKPGSTDSSSYFPHGLDNKVGARGMVIHGWAPQLLILSHPSTGGFVSHCGWNSTVEAVVRGVPFLAWPIRGDQYYNAKLLVSYLKVGIMVSVDYPADVVKKEDIIKGIERLVTDEDIKSRAEVLRGKFEHGFPTSSVDSLDAFKNFIKQ